jgi:hypothetical protein
VSLGEQQQIVEFPPKADLAPPPGSEICDEEFVRSLRQLKQLRTFLIEQAVPLKSAEQPVISFHELNLLRYKASGRSPTEREWSALEELTQNLFSHLTEPLRRQFIYGQISWWVPGLVVGLGLLAFLALWLSTHFWGADYEYILLAYIFWLAALGAIGSISFIGMNVLAVQNDATFGLTNAKLIALRIGLGALFGVVLTLPFGFRAYTNFIKALFEGGPELSSGVTFDSLMLLLPFILGFSTSLVIMILNQFVGAIESFFGKKTSPAPVAETPSATPGLPVKKPSGAP